MRIELHGRRVGGWILALDPEPAVDVELRPLRKWSGHGPAEPVIELAEWLARRWLGTPAKALRTASPARGVYRIAEPRVERFAGAVQPSAQSYFESDGATVRIAPAADRWPIVTAACALGNPLLLMPTADSARALAARLRRSGMRVALMPEQWAEAASGAVVVGTRAAALAPVHEPGAIVMFDEHDEAYREERTPTWHAREVIVERARRAGIPCVLVSPTPSLQALEHFPLHEMDRNAEHAAWPRVEVIDRRQEPPGRLGLFSESVANWIRRPGRVACILNRTGRVRLLGCLACGELTRCDSCGAAVRQVDDRMLTCMRCEAERPPACAACGGARLKNIVLGVGRAREELEALVGEPVGEVTASSTVDGDRRVVIGTEALLRRASSGPHRWATVVFLDFDQHLTALRPTAESEALGLLATAARAVGPRKGEGVVVVQTRLGDHRVIDAARRGQPGALARSLRDQAEAMRWPPVVAEAEISGPGAPAFVERIGRPLGIDILGPRDDRWLIRATDNDTLTAALAAIDRGDDRLRLAVI